jgi:hypothetical protein
MSDTGIPGTAIHEIDVLWITAGLGCDGDTIAMTAATQPSLEDIVLSAIPWIPKVNFHNPFLATENGEDFLKRFHHAAEGKIDPFMPPEPAQHMVEFMLWRATPQVAWAFLII